MPNLPGNKWEVLSASSAVIAAVCAVISVTNSIDTSRDVERAEKIADAAETSANAAADQAQHVNSISNQLGLLAIEVKDQSDIARTSSDIATRSADATETMAQVASRQLERQQAEQEQQRNLRPQLQITDPRMWGMSGVAEEPFRLQFGIQNFGPKPALRVLVSQSANFYPSSTFGVGLASCHPNEKISFDSISSGQNVSVDGLNNWKLTNRSQELADPSKSFYIYGAVCYYDDKSKLYTESFCVKVSKKRKETGYRWDFCQGSDLQPR